MKARRHVELIAIAALLAAAVALGVVERQSTRPRSPSPATAPSASPSTGPSTPPPDAGAIAVVGDSLSVQAAGAVQRELPAAGWHVLLLDTQMGRRITAQPQVPPSSGITAVRALRAASGDPLTWVIELGTNDVPAIGTDVRAAEQLIEAMLDEIGPGRRVVWVNVYQGPQQAAAVAFNRALDQVAARRTGTVVADWASRAWYDGYLAADRVHLTDAGKEAYASMIAGAARRAQQPPPYAPRGLTVFERAA